MIDIYCYCSCDPPRRIPAGEIFDVFKLTRNGAGILQWWFIRQVFDEALPEYFPHAFELDINKRGPSRWTKEYKEGDLGLTEVSS